MDQVVPKGVLSLAGTFSRSCFPVASDVTYSVEECGVDTCKLFNIPRSD